MEALRRKGFGPQWIKWMELCICSGQSSVLLNGKLVRTIQCKWRRPAVPVDLYHRSGCLNKDDQES